jgi:hypothetical protein
MLDGSVVLMAFEDAALIYSVSVEQLQEALRNRWILGDPESGVDELTVKKWLRGREQWLQAQKRREARNRKPEDIKIGLHVVAPRRNVNPAPVKKARPSSDAEISIADAAAYLGVKAVTMSVYASRGIVHRVRNGYISRDSFEALCNRRRRA